MLAGGGRYVAIAAAKPGHRLDLPYEQLYAREIAVIACRNYDRGDFATAIGLVAEGSVDPRPLCAGVYELSHFEEALTALTEEPAEHLKILLTRAELLGSDALRMGRGRKPPTDL